MMISPFRRRRRDNGCVSQEIPHSESARVGTCGFAHSLHFSRTQNPARDDRTGNSEICPVCWFYIKIDETNRVTVLYTSSSSFRTRYGIEVGDIREHVLESIRPSHSAEGGEDYITEYSRSLGFGWLYKNINGTNRIARLFVFPPK